MTVVDALGKACPIPVVMTKKALAEMTEPGTLKVLVDNETAVQNVSRLATGKNYKN
ncbi:MAG: sulfurtransferase TusA family protein, partial [Firmicutes bacterium]|nr:sulfurtransferase TusA family protein [Bacillota bacterium]